MSITTVSSRDFNQDVSKVKRAAQKGPIIITDRGQASHVLMTIEEYQILMGNKLSIVDLLAMPDTTEVEFNPPKLNNKLYQRSELN